MEVLPDSSANRAWDSDVMLQPRQGALYGLGYEPGHYRTALYPELSVIQKLEMARRVADNQAAEAFVAHQNVRAQSEDEILQSKIASGSNCPCQIIGRCCIVKEIGRTTDLECGVWSKRLIALEPLSV